VSNSAPVTVDHGHDDVGRSSSITGTVLVPKSVTTLSYDLDGNLTSDGVELRGTRRADSSGVSSIGDSASASWFHLRSRAGVPQESLSLEQQRLVSTPSADLRMVYDGRRLLAPN
jgi:hypothetical protein